MVAAMIASSAWAQSSRNIQRPSQTQDRSISREPYGGQRRFGIDPDPNVQFDLLRQQNWRKG
jgi:hypothetical protein